MIVSLNFLSHFWKIKPSISDIKNALMKSGIEIEAYEKIVVPTNLCYGIVESVEKIQNSKKLNACKVFIPNTNETLNIICGANNVKKGIKVLVANVGAELLNKKILIEKKTIFGHESNGMICGFSELYESKILKVPKKINLGIIELDPTWNCHRSFHPKDLNLNDHILDLSIPIHRKDLHCVWSLATEIQKNLEIENQDTSIYQKIDDFSSWTIRSLLWNNNFFPYIYQNKTEETVIWEEKTQYIFASFNELIEPSVQPYKVHEKSSYFFNELVLRYVAGYKPKPDNIPKPFSINWERMSNLFQHQDIQTHAKNYLTKSHFTFNNNTITPPPWRNDLKNEGDFLNELSIVFELNNMKPEAPCFINIPKIKDQNTEYNLNKKISNFLTNIGFIECITPNFQQQSNTSKYNIFQDKNIHKLSNPSSSKDTLRKHALIELLKVIEFNKKQKNQILPIFEITNISGINENYWVCNIVCVNDPKTFALNTTSASNDIYDLMSLIKRMSHVLSEKWSYSPISSDIHTLFNPDTIQILKNNKIIGYIGNLNNQNFFDKDLKLGQLHNNTISCAIIKLDKHSNPNTPNIFKNIPLYPVSTKDISILMPQDYDKTPTIQQIIDLIQNTPYCIECKLTEKYIKHTASNNTDTIVYLFRVCLQSDTETLTKEQIHNSLNIITKKLEAQRMKVQ